MRTYFGVCRAVACNRLGIVPRPSICTYLVTWTCNCRCPYCHIWKRTRSAEMTLAQVKKAFRDLKSLDVIRITGGEPFTRRDLADIVNYFLDHIRPSIIHITTNGFLTERIVQFMHKVHDPRRIHLKISIDAVGSTQDRIRGLPGLSKAIDATTRQLKRLRKRYGFYLAFNHIITKDNLASLPKLVRYVRKHDTDVVFAFAHKGYLLYQDGKGGMLVNENPYPELEGDYTKRELKDTLAFIIKHNKVNNLAERLIDRYYMVGFRNRLLHKQLSPKPGCVALGSHIRVLPNGDVPICMYDVRVVGNLVKENFRDIWYGKDIEKYRQKIKRCPGCWIGCETKLNAVYSGDILRAFFMR